MPSSTDPEQGVGGLHAAPSGNAALLSERVLQNHQNSQEKIQKQHNTGKGNMGF